MSEFCSCHSGVKKGIEHLEQEYCDQHGSIKSAHERIDQMEREKVSLSTLKILVGIFIVMFGVAFGYQTYKLRAIDEIDKGVAVLQYNIKAVEHAIERIRP